MYEPKNYRKKRRRQASCPAGIVTGILLILILVAMGIWLAVDPAVDKVLALSTEPPAQSTAPLDNQPPKIDGVHDFTIYQGDTISYMNGITATDETDPNPALTVDCSNVDLGQPGEYQVVYTATDASGNTCQAAAAVVVLLDESYVDLHTIYAAADAKLEEIIRENATIRQQVHDVYAWARLNLIYGGHSDRTDWRQTAYEMLTEGEGDCYGFWAVTKLLFDRLEIPNIDVQKVKNSEDDTDHFWSLVSLDGGETWYHFDSTPRYGDGDNFCLVTDAFLDAYSEAHEGSHNRDKSLYPATPEEMP